MPFRFEKGPKPLPSVFLRSDLIRTRSGANTGWSDTPKHLLPWKSYFSPNYHGLVCSSLSWLLGNVVGLTSKMNGDLLLLAVAHSPNVSVLQLPWTHALLLLPDNFHPQLLALVLLPPHKQNTMQIGDQMCHSRFLTSTEGGHAQNIYYKFISQLGKP